MSGKVDGKKSGSQVTDLIKLMQWGQLDMAVNSAVYAAKAMIFSIKCWRTSSCGMC